VSSKPVIEGIDSNVRKVINSPKGNQFAYEIERNGKFVTIYDGKEGKEYFPHTPSTPRHVFSPDGKQFAYIARTSNGNTVRVILNWKEGKEYQSVNELTFSPDSKELAYIAFNDKRAFVVVGEKELKRFDGVSGLKYEPDGISYSAFLFGGKWIKVKGDKETPLDCKDCIRDDNGNVIGKKEQRYNEKGDFAGTTVTFKDKKSKDYESIDNLRVGPKGNRFAYTASSSSAIFPVIDGEETKFRLSVDKSCCGEGGHWFEIWNYDSYTFSPDGKRLGFLEHDEETRVILDGEYISDKQYLIGNLKFSPDSKLFTYVVKDSWNNPNFSYVIGSNQGKKYQAISEAVFVGDNEIVYLGYDKNAKAIEKVSVACEK